MFSENAAMLDNSPAAIANRMKFLRQRADLSLLALAQRMGYRGASSIQRYESPDYSGGYLKRELVAKLEKALLGKGDPPIQRREIWELAGPEFAEPAPHAIRRGADAEGFDAAALNRFPIRGEVAAGRWLETPALLALEEITDFVEGLSVTPGLAQWTYGLRVRGTSINRLAVDGDILVCLDAMSGIEFVHRDLVIVERVRDQGALREVTAKRLLRQDGRWVLQPESTDAMWQTIIELDEIPQDDAETRFIAKVKHIIKPVG